MWAAGTFVIRIDSAISSVKIIDCHTHCYPPELTSNPTDWAISQGELHWAKLVAPADKPSIQGWATMKQMLTAMDSAGIEKSVLLGWYWENEATCRWHNEVIANWVKTEPERFIGFAAIHPGVSSKKVLEQCEHALNIGLKGVGELHPGIQQFSASSEGWKTLAEWCTLNHWPINIHATEAVGKNHSGNIPTPLQDFLDMARNSPQLKLILAHWGGGLAFFELNPALRKSLKNVYYDTAATPLLYEPSIFRHIIEIVGADKILFGSDYPLKVYPKKQKRPDFTTFLNSIRDNTNLTSEDYTAIMHRNLQTLLEP